MGNCCSGKRESPPKNKTVSNGINVEPAITPAPKPDPLDDQLVDLWDYITPLGTGGSGETGLFRHRHNGEEVAIKFMKRPVPRVVLPHIQRELQITSYTIDHLQNIDVSCSRANVKCLAILALDPLSSSSRLRAQIQADLGEGHVNIVEAKEVILTDKHLCLVMEYAAGNSLTGYVSDKWRAAQRSGLFLTEDEARFYFRQFISAVAYCHDNSVAHRDLKLDNALLDGKAPATIKLCDFGFAKQWGRDSTMFTDIGTTAYMSPEQLDKQAAKQGYNGAAVDVWAAGVLLVIMLLANVPVNRPIGQEVLTGKFPFDHIKNSDPNSPEAHTEVLLQQKGGWSEVPIIRNALRKARLSPEVMDLLNRILVVSHAQRMTIPDIKAHPWYKMPLPRKYQQAEQQLRIEQKNIDEHNRIRAVSSAAKTARDLRLKAIVVEAGRRPASFGGEVTRINLRPIAAENGDAAISRLI